MNFNSLYEASVPGVMPYLTVVPVDTEHSVEFAYRNRNRVIAIEGVNVVGNGSRGRIDV